MMFSVIRDRDLDYNITANEIHVDGMLYHDKKDQLEVTIGEGMEFTIHGMCVPSIEEGIRRIEN